MISNLTAMVMNPGALTAARFHCRTVVVSDVVLYPSLVSVLPMTILGLLFMESLCDHAITEQTR